MKTFPTGIDSFREIMRGDRAPFYYVDKTPLISELFRNGGKVNLIPRPRHFGKSLNLDMIRQFFDITADPTLFDGLKISDDRAFCKKFQGQYPVLYFNMKEIKGPTFANACNQVSAQIVSVMEEQCAYLLSSPALSQGQRDICAYYAAPLSWKGESLPRSDLEESLEFLTHYLEVHHGKKVVVLIDEYDVPLHYAFANKKTDPGYYDKMVGLLGNMFSGLLKSNPSIAFAVVTGCVQISHKSVFSGVNNLVVWGYDRQFSQEYFGFTESEVKAMLDYYGIPGIYDTTKEWYYGFNFGGDDLYCPWDVLQYVDNCISATSSKEPQMFWANSSGNDILTKLLQRSSTDIQQQYLELMGGKSITTWIEHEMAFWDLEDVDNTWSLMLASGYLTVVSEEDGDVAVLRASNLEVRKLLADHLSQWACSFSAENEARIRRFCTALPDEDEPAATTALTDILTSMIHQQDQNQSGEQSDSLYPGIVLGLLYRTCDVVSNIETGNGYCDISFETDKKVGVAIEMKDPRTDDLDKAAHDALDQIKAKHYTQKLQRHGCKKILMYGIACRLHTVSMVMEVCNAPQPQAVS